MNKKYLVIGISLLAILFYANSCINDENSLGQFRVDIATVDLNSDGSFSLTLDDATRLWPAASDLNYVPVQDQRVFVNYTILSRAQNGYDHYIKINDIWDILTKKAINLTENNADSIGNDPVKVNSMWVGNDFLNVDFMFNYGGTRPHAINLVKNTLVTPPNDGKIHLEFRHNAYESINTRLYDGFVCFDLKPLRLNNADSVQLSVKVKDWDGEKTYDLVYRYNEAALRNTYMKPSIPVISSNEYY